MPYPISRIRERILCITFVNILHRRVHDTGTFGYSRTVPEQRLAFTSSLTDLLHRYTARYDVRGVCVTVIFFPRREEFPPSSISQRLAAIRSEFVKLVFFTCAFFFRLFDISPGFFVGPFVRIRHCRTTPDYAYKRICRQYDTWFFEPFPPDFTTVPLRVHQTGLVHVRPPSRTFPGTKRSGTCCVAGRVYTCIDFIGCRRSHDKWNGLPGGFAIIIFHRRTSKTTAVCPPRSRALRVHRNSRFTRRNGE